MPPTPSPSVVVQRARDFLKSFRGLDVNAETNYELVRDLLALVEDTAALKQTIKALTMVNADAAHRIRDHGMVVLGHDTYRECRSAYRLVEQALREADAQVKGE